jgi:potassium uptake TrkH family protein
VTRVRAFLSHPARVVPTAFLALIVVGAFVLSLPALHPDTGWEPLVGLFTATSAICVTGLAVVDTASYWSPAGQVMILVFVQVGGFGIMTMATLLSLVVSRRLGLRSRLTAAAETKTVGLADARGVLIRVALMTLVIEAAVAIVLTLRWWLGYDQEIGKAAWYGLFHGVAAFNNAGFSLFGNNLMDYVGDPWICLPVCLATILGGIGFPVIFELRRARVHPKVWSVHTKLTVWTTLLLLVVGTAAMYAFEWRNPATMGPLDTGTKLLAGFFQGVQPRSSGFNTLDYGAMREESWAVQTGLMFVGGGSASTAGGIKVSTFMLLGFVILAEIRSQPDVVVGDRRIPERVQRQALSVALIAVGVVALGTLALLAATPYSLGAVLFEATSAFSLVGLSTGITGTLGPVGQVLLVLLMYLGRVGLVSAAAFFALRERAVGYRYPTARPLVG